MLIWGFSLKSWNCNNQAISELYLLLLEEFQSCMHRNLLKSKILCGLKTLFWKFFGGQGALFANES